MKHTSQKVMALALALAMLASMAGCKKTVDPKKAVKEAAVASVSELGKLDDQFGMAEVNKLAAAGSCHQEMNFFLKEASVGADISAFYGTGMTLSADSSVKDRKILANLSVNVADYTLGTMTMAFDDAMVYLACQELLGEATYYGVNTETLSQDFPAMFEENYNVNLFDVMENNVSESGAATLAADTKKALYDAYNTMADASQWAAGEKASITSGEDSGECEHYTVSIPAEAFADFVVASAGALARDPYVSYILKSSLTVEGITYDEEYITQTLTDLETELKETFTQPQTADFYVKDKLLRAVELTVNDGADAIGLSLKLGMGKNLADRVELTVKENDASVVELVSAGSHVLADGKFVDATTLTADGLTVEMDTEYDVAGGGYAFTLYVDAEGEAITVSSNGTLKAEGKTMDMVIDDLTVDLSGMKVVLGGTYSVSEGSAVTIDAAGAKMIADLSDEDVAALSSAIQQNAYAILFGLMNEVPAVMEMIMGSGF